MMVTSAWSAIDLNVRNLAPCYFNSIFSLIFWYWYWFMD